MLGSDNFNDGDSVGWSQDVGTWSITNDGTNHVLNAISNIGENLFARGTSWSNYAIQSRIQLTLESEGSSGAGFVFRYQNV